MTKAINGILIISMLIFFANCKGSRSFVDKSIKDGIEVVSNHFEPYKINNEGSFILEELFKIDTESEDIANLGISNIQGFEVDSDGEIFCLLSLRGAEIFVYKFDNRGKYVKSFGSLGAGPGELQQPNYIFMDNQENIIIFDLGRHPINVYNKSGSFINSRELSRNVGKITSGPGLNSLILENAFDPATSENSFSLKMLDSDMKEASTLEKYSYKFARENLRVTEPVFCWSASKKEVFVANEERGYDIWVYDINGKLFRKIQKQYNKVAISENEKREILGKVPKALRSSAFFPEFYPPIRGIIAKEDGMLFVSTFEKSEIPGEFVFDIFNPDGVFIGRTNINVLVWENHLWARIVGDKFYCLREKISGFQELVVYKIKKG